MNCPHCGNRNPSTADHCLHCGTPFSNKRGDDGFFDIDSDDADSFWNSDKLFYYIGGVFVVIIGGSMLLFGFDTYESTCVRSASAAERYESAPDWERDESIERRRIERRRSRYRKSTGTRLPESSIGYLRCYKRKTGHVDGTLE